MFAIHGSNDKKFENILRSLDDNLRSTKCIQLSQGMVDGSASKPALIQDTSFMVEKT